MGESGNKYGISDAVQFQRECNSRERSGLLEPRMFNQRYPPPQKPSAGAKTQLLKLLARRIPASLIQHQMHPFGLMQKSNNFTLLNPQLDGESSRIVSLLLLAIAQAGACLISATSSRANETLVDETCAVMNPVCCIRYRPFQ